MSRLNQQLLENRNKNVGSRLNQQLLENRKLGSRLNQQLLENRKKNVGSRLNQQLLENREKLGSSFVSSPTLPIALIIFSLIMMIMKLRLLYVLKL